MELEVASDRAIVLEEVLDTAKAASLRDQFQMRRGHHIDVDASGVRHLGALCAQVLLSAVATWRSDERRLTIMGPSEPFREGVAVLGLLPFLSCEV